jgi:NitT/TauT family transport system permease protein
MRWRFLLRLVYPMIGVVLIIAAWMLACWLANIPTVVLPTPDKVLRSLMQRRELLLGESFITLKETLYGFLLALAIGLPLAVAVANSRALNLMFYPLLIALQSVPKVALAPMILVWLGTGLESKLAIVWLVAFFPIIVDTAAGLRATPKELLELPQGPAAGGAAVRRHRRQGRDHARGHRRGDRGIRGLERRARLSAAERDLTA